jgi:transposase
MGNWYLNLVVEVPVLATHHEVESVGVDLGLKDSAVLSDGTRIENPRIYAKYEEKLGGFQCHGKRKQARRLAVRIKNIRKDFIHKKTLELAKKFKTIFIGDVSGKFLQASHGKSSADASTGAIRSALSYKAVRHQGRVVEVSERSTASTVTCSQCLKKTGPSGLSDLRVREWICSACETVHDRDVNAALNHLRVGSDSLKRLLAA